AMKVHVLARRQLTVEARILEHDAEGAAHQQRLLDRVVAGDPEPPLAWAQHRRQHLDCGRLAGAIRAEKPEDDALRYLERDMVDRGKAVEALDQIAGLDDRGHYFLPNKPSRQNLSRMTKIIEERIAKAEADAAQLDVAVVEVHIIEGRLHALEPRRVWAATGAAGRSKSKPEDRCQ